MAGSKSFNDDKLSWPGTICARQEWRRQVKSRKPLSRKHLQQMWLAPLR